MSPRSLPSSRFFSARAGLAGKIDWNKIEKPELVLQRFPSRRSVVYGTKGMVSSSQPLATEAGLEILRKGGNAADAAIATSAALNVTEPGSCGIGGDAFCLFYDAKTKHVKALNGSGRSPRRLTIDYLRSRGITGSCIPATDLNSVTVPGAAAAWVDTVARFGSGRLSLAEVLEPAIRLAEEGVPISELSSFAWQEAETFIKTASPDADAMLLNGKAPLPGQIKKNLDLARTFRSVAEHGSDGFYKGRIAQAIVELVQGKGGLMDIDDLAQHKTTLVEPIKYTFAGEVSVYECPPNGQGLTALLALGIIDHIQQLGISKPVLEMEHNSVEYLHLLIECLRLAFSDTQYYVTDPKFKYVPVNELLSKEYLNSRAKLFNPQTANPDVVHGMPVNSSDTVYFSVADQWGNACSFIQSNYAGFGTAAIPRGCGFTLQNRGSGFTLIEGHPNALEGGKRPYHTIIPALALRGKDLFLSFGVMGAFMQPQGHVQVLLNVLRGFTVQAALDAPRFCISARTPDTNMQSVTGLDSDKTSKVSLEEGISEDTIAKLREMGHDVRVAKGFQRSVMGCGQIIQRITDDSGCRVWAAGSDPRADGHAAAHL